MWDDANLEFKVALAMNDGVVSLALWSDLKEKYPLKGAKTSKTTQVQEDEEISTKSYFGRGQHTIIRLHRNL